jgi:glycosyltransferase involved in cell wall biosynthesis
MATVGIGIPVYNGERFLPASLESLLGQTYEDIEFVVSDNGSTDGTAEICRDFAARDSRLRYVHSPTNRGAAWNYANVVRETSSPYFKWATHDDLVAPNYVERCLEVFRGGPETIGVVYGRTAIIDEAGNVKRDYDDNLDIRDETPWMRLGRLVRNIVMSNASFGVIRRSVVERSRLLGAFPSADYAMMAEFAMLGQIWEIPEVLFFRREHAAMSRAANPSATEAAEWFLPGSSKGKRMLETWRLFGEHFRSIHAVPLSRTERALCYAVLVPTWARRYGPRMAFEPFGVYYTRGWRPFRRRG